MSREIDCACVVVAMCVSRELAHFILCPKCTVWCLLWCLTWEEFHFPIKIPISNRVQAPEQFSRTWPELFLGLGLTTKSSLIKILRLFEVHRDFGIPSRINTDVIYTTSVHTI